MSLFWRFLLSERYLLRHYRHEALSSSNIHIERISRLIRQISVPSSIFSSLFVPFQTQCELLSSLRVRRLSSIPSVWYHFSWPWSYGSWIYNYLCNQCLSPLLLWFRISIRARCTTLCDKVCQWFETGRLFSPGPPVSSTNKTDHHEITEILLKVALNTIINNIYTSSLPKTTYANFDWYSNFYFILKVTCSVWIWPFCAWGNLRWEVVVCFLDVGGIVYHCCFDFSFHKYL